eukprot:7222715-Prymnesium_polylepis.1
MELTELDLVEREHQRSHEAIRFVVVWHPQRPALSAHAARRRVTLQLITATGAPELRSALVGAHGRAVGLRATSPARVLYLLHGGRKFTGSEISHGILEPTAPCSQNMPFSGRLLSSCGVQQSSLWYPARIACSLRRGLARRAGDSRSTLQAARLFCSEGCTHAALAACGAHVRYSHAARTDRKPRI